MASSTSSKKRQPGLVPEDGVARPPGARPQLIDQLPKSIFTSPGVIAGIVAFELLYGMVLFGVMSSVKRQRLEEQKKALVAKVERVEPPLAAHPAPSNPPSKAEQAGEEKETSKVVESKPRPRSKTKAGSETQTAVASTSDSPPVTAESKGTPTQADAKPSRSETSSKSEQGKLAMASPTPAPTTIDEPPPTSFPGLGDLIDPLRDSKITATSDTVTIKVASGPHVFDAMRGLADAPRSMTEVEGDFVAQVRVLGNLKPGTKFIKGLNFAFQGAGILIWQDPENYVRFERTSMYNFKGERLYWVFLESVKPGRKPSETQRVVRDAPVTLKVERQGKTLTFSYSTDEKTWLKVNELATTLPPKIMIGIAATNVAPRELTARFSNFEMTPAPSSR